MKRFTLSVALLLASFATADWNTVEAQEKTLRTIENTAFKPGEHLSFRIHYGWFDAGYGELYVKKGKSPFMSRDAYHLIATGRSNSKYDWIFKVRDKYESFFDQQALVPWNFIRNIDEGGFKLHQNVTFRQTENMAHSTTGQFRVPDHVQDILSAFYYARTWDVRHVKVGDVFNIPVFLDDEIFNMKIKFKGKTEVETDAGTWRCLVFMPVVLKGRVFKEEEDLQIYVSDDENKIPVGVKANILVGSVKMTLTDVEGLRNPPRALISEN